MKRSQRATTVALLACAAAACASAPQRPAVVYPYDDDLSLRGFVAEALYGFGTPRTHRFDDYTKGSYHLRPREFLEELFRRAPELKRDLRSAVVVGPYGPLWAYDVVTVVQDGECTRVNWLLMPHARITVKRSGCLTPGAVASALAELGSVVRTDPATDGGDSCALLADAGGIRGSRFDCDASSEGLERLDAALRTLTEDLPLTYSAYSPLEE